LIIKELNFHLVAFVHGLTEKDLAVPKNHFPKKPHPDLPDAAFLGRFTVLEKSPGFS
jgi:hypothetical protein